MGIEGPFSLRSLALPEREFWSIENQAKVLELSRPLLTQNIFRTVTYARVFDDHTYYSLHSDLRCAEYGFVNKIHVTAHVPKEIVKSQFWHMPPRSETYQQVYKDYLSIFGVRNVLDFTIRHKGYFDTFCFGSLMEADRLFNYFANSNDQLESFSHSFIDRLGALGKLANKNRLIISPERLPNFGGLDYEPVENRIPTQNSYELIRNLAQSRKISLSKREQECVRYLALGNTAREIANNLGLSVRTVEYYLDNIKSKLGCFKKSEIVSTLLKNSDGIIDLNLW